MKNSFDDSRNAENYLNVIPTVDNVDYNRIYEYSDSEVVNKFNISPLNRNVSQKRVKQLSIAYQNKSVYIPPIIVDVRTLTIGEGQHRRGGWLEAPEHLRKNLQVIYVNCESEKELINWIITINNQGKSWQTRDYYYSLLADNNPYVKIMDTFIHDDSHSLLLTKRGIPQIRYALALFNVNESFLKNRKIQFGRDAEDNAEIVYRDFEKMFAILGWNSSPWIEYVLRVWYSIRIEKKDDILFHRLNTIGIDYFISKIKIMCDRYDINPSSKTNEWRKFFHEAIDELYYSKKMAKVA